MTDYNTDPAYEGIRLPPPPRGDGKPNYDALLLPTTPPRQRAAAAPAPAKKGGENVPLWCGALILLAVVNVVFGVRNGSTANFVVAALLGAAALYYWQKHTADRPTAAAAADDDDDMVTLHDGRRVTRAQYEDLAARSAAHRQAQGQNTAQQPPRPHRNAEWDDDDEAGF